MKLPSQPIGVFDSGIGGLTVMEQLINTLPNERFVYFGDTARVPYGNKSPQTIIRYSIENTIYLLEKDIKLLIVACNTASAYALPKLRQLFNVPIIGVIEAGAIKAVESTRNQRIAVLGTKGTIESGAYQSAIHKLTGNIHIHPIACPLLVPLIEERWWHHPISKLVIEEYLRPIHKEGIDTVLLGCTHYPLLSSLIQEELGDNITLIDSASTCALQAATLLKKHSLDSPIKQGHHEYFVSDDPEKFSALAEYLFHSQPITVKLTF